MADDPRSQSWWQTLPGILTATAAILTAVSGLLAILFQNGVIGGKHDAAPPSATTVHSPASSSPGTASSASTQAPGTLKPWSKSDVVITTNEGVSSTLRAESLSNCISVNHALTTGSGQDIPFEKMRRFEVLRADAVDAPNAKATVLITLLDGTKIEDVVTAGCDIFGYNDVGRFTTYFQRLKRVDFQR